MDRTLANLEELQTEAARFAGVLQASPEKATLVTLSGELGSGKTSYAQGVAARLGIEEHVTSPTFVLEKVYQLPQMHNGFSRLVHIDAYRLKGGSELAALGFDEIMRDPASLVLLEWPERVSDSLPPASYALALAVAGEGRTLSYA